MYLLFSVDDEFEVYDMSSKCFQWDVLFSGKFTFRRFVLWYFQ